MRIGLLGGSFDPIHLAHIALAKAAQQYLALDEVQLILAKQPWQKPTLNASAQHRLQMVKLATDDEPGLIINTMELERPGKTYTIETLEQLPDGHEYYWLFGADQLQNFCTWHRWEDIASRVTLIAATRPGADLQTPIELQRRIDAGQAKLDMLPFEPMAISSSQLRERLARGSDVNEWLNPMVAQYIAHNNLYRTDNPDS